MSQRLNALSFSHPDDSKLSAVDAACPSIRKCSSEVPIVAVARRNERERKRVRLVNQGFAILRDRIPMDGGSRGRRSSKVETLRAAIMYIRQLQQLLMENQMIQDMAECYTALGDDSFFNTPLSSVCDRFVLSYSQGIMSQYPQFRANLQDTKTDI